MSAPPRTRLFHAIVVMGTSLGAGGCGARSPLEDRDASPIDGDATARDAAPTDASGDGGGGPDASLIGFDATSPPPRDASDEDAWHHVITR